ncbi:hypothetical protein QZH41_001692 [Actinostola sp. cb2023]|nr:hypothetical protein QZH41_001692 [Actinostola sp. cb2023]
MRPISSATKTYNYNLAKWLNEKLKSLSVNQYTITDTFVFADELRKMSFKESDVLISYDVTSLFTNVPLVETISIIADKAFANNWFNTTHKLNITKADLIDLLNIATKDQLFQFNGILYEQIDGVAMGSPLGPLIANAFMCSIEEHLQGQGKLPSFYKRYVDDTLTAMSDEASAGSFLSTLNEQHPSIKFSMEMPSNNVLPFLGEEVTIKLSDIIEKSTMRRDVAKMSPLGQTSALEGYHSLVNHFAPKMIHFSYHVMEARLRLAALHYNENANREQAKNSDGDNEYSIKYPKAKKGGYVVAKISAPCTYS